MLDALSGQVAVTTCYRPEPAHLARARVLGERFRVPVVERAAWPRLFAQSGARYLYVVGRDHEEIRDAGGHNCFVQEGLLTIKMGTATDHPLIRAVGADCASVIDATLGIANDAVHIATALAHNQCRVRGIEASPLISALLEEGLPRIARERPAASRISVENARASDVLKATPARDVDVVYLDPMMSRPKRSAPSMVLLRELALDERASPELFAQAARVARKRVVLKLGRGAPVPPTPPDVVFARHERGMRVTYWIHDVASAAARGDVDRT